MPASAFTLIKDKPIKAELFQDLTYPILSELKLSRQKDEALRQLATTWQAEKMGYSGTDPNRRTQAPGAGDCVDNG